MTERNHNRLFHKAHFNLSEMSPAEVALDAQLNVTSEAAPEKPYNDPSSAPDSGTEQANTEQASTKHIVIDPDDPDEEALRVQMLPCLLNIGACMLDSGADVRQVERILGRVGRAYGAEKMNVFVITAVIVVTMTMPSGREYTQTRRIAKTDATDFTKLEALNDLCVECCNHPLPLDELHDRFRAIYKKKMGNVALFVGGILCIGAFSVFFGGSWLEVAVAALIGVMVCLTMKYWRAYLPNDLVYNFVVAFLSGVLIGIAGDIFEGLNEGLVMVGVIMILIPGVSMTNSLRDLIAGDTISGVMRLIESLLWAVALALGFMLAMIVMGWSG